MKFAALFAFVAAPLFAQQPSLPPLVEKLDVTVINVDVSVTRRSGEPVADLTPNDFELFEDGKPQKITNFYVVDHAVVRQEAGEQGAAVPQARFRRKAVLLVDNHFIDKRLRDAALIEVRKFIESDYAGQYDWSIGSIGGGVHMIQPFTSDKKTIERVLFDITSHGTIAPVVQSGVGTIADPSQRNTTPVNNPEGQTPGNSQAAREERAARMIEADKDIRFVTALQALRSSAMAVIDACRALEPVQGKKLLVLVTSGMEMDSPTSNGSNPIGGGTHSDNDREAVEIRQAMTREANAANVNIYVINAAGTAPSVAIDVATKLPPVAVRSEVRDFDSLPSALARETGGLYLTKNAVGDSIRTIDSVSATFYSLGYRPPHFEDGKYHKIEVRLKKPAGYRIQSRSGYLDASNDQRLTDSLKVDIGASLPETALPVNVAVGTKVSKGTQFIIPVTASMPLGRVTTIRRGDSSAGRVHVYLSVFDDSGANVAFHHATQDVQLSDEQLEAIAAAPESRFRYSMNVDLSPGKYRVVVAVRDELSDEVGKASTTIDIRG